MIILDETDNSLEVLLNSAVATVQCPIYVSFVDVTTTDYTPGKNATTTNSTTPVTVVAAPAASSQRQIKLLTVFNADSAEIVLTLRLNNNSVFTILFKATLGVGDTLQYVDGEGYKVINSNGETRLNSVTSQQFVPLPDKVTGSSLSITGSSDFNGLLRLRNIETSSFNQTPETGYDLSSIIWADHTTQKLKIWEDNHPNSLENVLPTGSATTGSGGMLDIVNSPQGFGTWLKPARIFVTGSRINPTTTAIDIPGLYFRCYPKKRYIFNFTISYSAAAASTGIMLGLASASFAGGLIQTQAPFEYFATCRTNIAAPGTAADFGGNLTSLDRRGLGCIITGSAVQAANVRYMAKIEGYIYPKEYTVISPIFASEIGNSALSISSSWGELDELNVTPTG